MDETSILSRSVAAGLGVAAGIALGWVALWTGTVSAAFDTSPSLQDTGPSVQACTQALPEIAAGAEALESEVATLQFEEGLLRSQLSLIGGLPIAWPDDVAPQWRESQVRERVDAAMAGVEGMVLHELDCSEYPCQLVVESPGDDQHPGLVSSDTFDALTDALAPGLPIMVAALGPEGRRVAFITLTDAELDREIGTRVDVRRQQAAGRVMGEAP